MNGRKGLPHFRSVRARLMFGNMFALAVILGVLGGLVRYTVQANMLRTIDSELKSRAAFRPHMHPHGPDGGPGGPPPQGFGPGSPAQMPPGFLMRALDGRWQNPSERRPEWRQPPERERQPPFEEAFPTIQFETSEEAKQRQAAEATMRLMRPRHLNLNGEALDPFPRGPFGGKEYPWDRTLFALSAKGEEKWITTYLGTEPLRIYSAPIWQEGTIIGVVQTAFPLADMERAIQDINRTLLAFIPIALLLAGAGGALLTNRALRPVQRIAWTAQQIGARDLSRRLPVVGRDEFSQLAATINGMLARLEADFTQKEDLVRQQERLIEQQRRFTADASHELRTPLTIIKANASLSRRGAPTEAEYREVIEEIDQAADTMSRLVQDLLLLARADGAQLGRHRLSLSACDVLTQASANVRPSQSVPVCLDISDDTLTLYGNADELVRVFTNLLENAARYTPTHGQITVMARREGEYAHITVTDTGVGIAPEHLPHLGERFYRVDTSRSRPDGGAGLGLSICKSILGAHGGTMTITSQVGKGTTVCVTLPRAEHENFSPSSES